MLEEGVWFKEASNWPNPSVTDNDWPWDLGLVLLWNKLSPSHLPSHMASQQTPRKFLCDIITKRILWLCYFPFSLVPFTQGGCHLVMKGSIMGRRVTIPGLWSCVFAVKEKHQKEANSDVNRCPFKSLSLGFSLKKRKMESSLRRDWFLPL